MEAKVYRFPIDTNQAIESSPDEYILSSPGYIPNDNFVVTRDAKGNPVSRYADMVWDFSAYDIKKRRIKIFFDNWTKDRNDKLKKSISNEIKHLFFIICWITENDYKSSSSLRAPHEALVRLAQFSHSKNVRVLDVLKSEMLLQEFLVVCAGGIRITFYRILGLLVQAGSEKIGFTCCAPDAIKGFSKNLVQYRESLKQHPPIPSRIYLGLISFLQDKLSEYENNIEGIVHLTRKHLEESYDGGTLYGASQAARRDGVVFKYNPDAPHKKGNKVVHAADIETIEKIANKFSLAEFFNKRALEYKPISLNRIFIEMYSICKVIIHVFTGMRHDEAAYLPYNCIDEFTYQGVKTQCIRGGTTKFGEKDAVWITNHDGHRAAKIVQKLALTIYEKIGISSPQSSSEVYRYPLFIKPVYAGLGVAPHKVSTYDSYSPVVRFKLQEYINIPISGEDLNELDRIDPFRVWGDEDNFQLGSRWVFTSHQFRRSLALYASSSGIVSLPSLKRQLKHMTEKMSLYYSKGSSFAENLLDIKNDHFAKEYQESAPISQALAYMSEIIFSDEKLFGPLGSNLEKDRHEFVIASDRDKTISMFKSGEVAYQETFLGGCSTTTPCESKALRSMISCLSCGKAIIKKSKLEIVIKAQENMVKRLSSTSVEFRSEHYDLLALKAALDTF